VIIVVGLIAVIVIAGPGMWGVLAQLGQPLTFVVAQGRLFFLIVKKALIGPAKKTIMWVVGSLLLFFFIFFC